MRGVWILLAILLVPMASAQVILGEFDVTPRQIAAGDDVRISYRIFAEEPLWTVKTDVFLEDAINHQEVDTQVFAHEYRFDKTFTVPDTYQGAEELNVRIITGRDSPIARDITMQVEERVPQEQDAPPHMLSQEPESISIRFEPIRNIDRAELVHFPITITSTYPASQEVLIGVEGVTWGTWAVLPEQVITIQPFGVQTAHLAIDVDPEAALGMHAIALTANYGGKEERVETKIAILGEEEEQESLPPWAWGIIIGALIVALAIGVIAWHRNKEEEDEDFVTYY